jgi:hypothetical protein
MVGAGSASETSVILHERTVQYVSSDVHTRRRENLKSHLHALIFTKYEMPVPASKSSFQRLMSFAL